MDVTKFNAAFRPLCLARHTADELVEFLAGRFCAATKFRELEDILKHEDIVYELVPVRNVPVRDAPAVRVGTNLNIKIKVKYKDPKMMNLTLIESFHYKEKSWEVFTLVDVSYFLFANFFLNENHLEDKVKRVHYYGVDYESIFKKKIPPKTLINLIYFD